MADNTSMLTEVPGTVWYTLSQFQSYFYSREKNSKKSPKTITSTADLRFEYNATTSNKTVNIGGTYMDVTGKSYSSSITLSPYTSIVLIYVSGTMTAGTLAEVVDENPAATPEKASFIIYPNPVYDNFNLEIANSHTGKMNIQIVSQTGALVHSLILNKEEQIYRVNLPANGLAPGVYFVHVQMDNWSDTKRFVKL